MAPASSGQKGIEKTPRVASHGLATATESAQVLALVAAIESILIFAAD
jgi:hypothetical protein